MWTGRQAYKRGLIDQLGGLREAIASAAKLAHLHARFHVHYLERPAVDYFERLLTNFSQGETAQALLAAGLRLPPWLARLPQAAPELKLLQSMQSRTPRAYAYCFCGLH